MGCAARDTPPPRARARATPPSISVRSLLQQGSFAASRTLFRAAPCPCPALDAGVRHPVSSALLPAGAHIHTHVTHCPPRAHTHTHTHTHAHAHTRMIFTAPPGAHALTHTRTHARTHAHMIFTAPPGAPHARTHARTHARKHDIHCPHLRLQIPGVLFGLAHQLQLSPRERSVKARVPVLVLSNISTMCSFSELN